MAAIGVSYHHEEYPIVLSGAVDYSTIEAEMPLSFIIDDQVETFNLPFPGVNGWGWNVNVRYTFNFEQAVDQIFEFLQSGFGLFDRDSEADD